MRTYLEQATPMEESREEPPVDDQLEGLRMNLESVGFSEPDDIERVITAVKRLNVDETYQGQDPNGVPFRITRTAEGLEFETDEGES